MSLANDIISGKFNKQKKEESIADSIINGTFSNNSLDEIKTVEPTINTIEDNKTNKIDLPEKLDYKTKTLTKQETKKTTSDGNIGGDLVNAGVQLGKGVLSMPEKAIYDPILQAGSSKYNPGMYIADDNKSTGDKIRDFLQATVGTLGKIGEVANDISSLGLTKLIRGESASDKLIDDVYKRNKSSIDSKQSIAKELIEDNPTQKYLINDKLGYDKVLSDGRTVQETLDDNAKLIKSTNLGGQIFESIGAQLPSMMVGAGSGEIGSLGVMGLQSYGSGLEEAYKNGATREEANRFGLMTAAIETATEKMFAGVGGVIGKGPLDESIEALINDKIKNKIAAYVVNYGLDMIGEGVEEVASDLLNPIAKKLSYASEEELKKLYEDEDYLNDFLSGALSAGVMKLTSAPYEIQNIRNENQQNEIQDTHHLNKTQAKIDKPTTQNIIQDETQEETRGTTLNEIMQEENVVEDEINEITEETIETEDLINDFQNYVSESNISNITDKDISNYIEKLLESREIPNAQRENLYQKYSNTIKEYLNENLKLNEDNEPIENETPIESNNVLNETKPRDTLNLEARQAVRQKENILTQKQNENIKNPLLAQQIKNNDINMDLIREAQNKSIANSVQAFNLEQNFKQKPGNFVYIKSENPKIDAFRRQAATYMRNGQQTQNFVKTIEKIIQDKGVEVRFDPKLGNNVNGTYKNGVITLNPNSTRAGEFLAIHELTHAIGTKSMIKMIENYRKSNAEFNEAVEKLLGTYKITEINEEALADIAGQLFGNQEYINNLSMENPSLFKRIYNEIKYLWNQFRGYKNQNQFIEDLKNKWESAYRNRKVKLKNNEKYSFAGEVALDNLIDDKETYKSLKKLKEMAEEKLNSGEMNNEEVRRKYKWFKDKNGQWKFEFTNKYTIIDKVLKNNHKYKLGNIINDDILFKLYPNLKNINVYTDKMNTPAGTTTNNDIYINNNILNNQKQLKASLLHEIQHIIQDYEGFEGGKSVSKDGIEAYINSLGEIEAIEVERRMDYDYNNLKMITPENSLPNPENPYKNFILDKYNNKNYNDNHEEDIKKNKAKIGTEKKGQNREETKMFRSMDRNMDGTRTGEKELDNSSFLNEKFSKQEGYTQEENNDLRDRAKEELGTTTNLNEAGYLTTDGEYLDFSGKKHGARGGQRQMDHRDIVDAYTDEEYDAAESKYSNMGSATAILQDFIDRGNIRLNNTGVEIATQPTKEQYDKLYDYIEHIKDINGDVFIDLDTETNNRENLEYNSKTSTNKIINDIKNHYENKYSKDNSTWREYLEKEFPNQGTRTNLQDINEKNKPKKVEDTIKQEKPQETPKKEVKKSFLNSKEQQELEGLKAVEETGLGLTEKEQARMEELEQKSKGITKKYPDLKTNNKYEDIKSIYGKYKDSQISTENNKVLKDAKEFIKANNQGRRTIQEWKQIAEYIGSNAKINSSQDLQKLAMETWFESKPNNASNLNRQGKKYIPFAVQDWVNEVYKGAGVGTEVKLSLEEGTDSKGNKIDLKPTEKGTYERVNTPKTKEVMPKEDFENKTVKIGDKSVSNFYSNITEKSKFITLENREKLKNNENLKYYDAITNKETLQDAMEKLNKNPEDTIGEFLTKDKFTPEDVATGWILIKRYQDAGNFENMSKIIEKMRDQGTKAGQTVQMYGILQRLTPEGMEYYAQKQLDNAYNKFVENKSKKQIEKFANDFTLTAEEHQFIKDTMEKVQTLEDEDAKKVEVAKIIRMLSDKLPPERGQRLKAWMRISMLGNPKTQVRNVVGNAIIQPVNWVGDIFSSKIDKALAKKTGVRTKGTTDFGALTKGSIKGFKDSVRDAKLGIDTRDINLNRFEENIGAKPFYEGHKSKALNKGAKALNKVNQVLGNVMSGGDRVFYQGIYENSLKNQMKLNKVTTPTQEMIDIATQEALQRTWNDSNTYTKSVLQIRNAMNKLNFKGYGLGDVLIPFAKTPANLTKAIVDYSPLGLVRSIVQDGKNFKNSLENGQYNAQLQHKFADSLGKGFAGSLLYVAAYALAKAGMITGKSDDDKDVANFMRNTLGIQPYSVKIGNKSFTYDWAQPIAAPFAIVSDFKRLSEQENRDLASLIETATSSASNILLEQSFLSSIQDVFNSYEGPSAAIKKQIEDLPARATPTFFKQIADMVDSKSRQTYVKGDAKETVKNKVQVKLPGASTELTSQRDTLGREIEKYGGDESKLKYAFNVFLNPANTNKGEVSEAAEEIYKVYQETGDKTIMPRQVGYSESIGGQTRNLTAEERNELQRVSGELVEENVKALVDSSKYQNMSSEDKAAVINGIVNYSFNKAKSEVFDVPISNVYKTADKKQQAGYSIADYYIDRVLK